MFTTHQVVDLAFGSPRRAELRLGLLYRLRVLDRFRVLVPQGSSPFHWVLGEAGAALVAAERGLRPTHRLWRRQELMALAATQHLGHLVGTNGFFTALVRASRHRPGCELADWWSEGRCASEWGGLAHPDGYGVWMEDGDELPFLLEYDNGTETLARLAAKLAGYAELSLASGSSTWVVFVFPSVSREANARQVLKHPSVPVATAVVPRGQSPDAALWLPLGAQRGRRRLVELGHPPSAMGLTNTS